MTPHTSKLRLQVTVLPDSGVTKRPVVYSSQVPAGKMFCNSCVKQEVTFCYPEIYRELVYNNGIICFRTFLLITENGSSYKIFILETP